MVDTKMTGLSQGVPNCLLDIKLSVTSKTDVASTLQDAEMVVETKVGIPVKVNADSGGKPNCIPERR